MDIGASPILCQLSFNTAVAAMVKYMIMSVTPSDRIYAIFSILVQNLYF